MRPTTLLTTLVAVATAVLLTLGLTAPLADAAAPVRTAAAAAKPKHQLIRATDTRITNHKFVIKGKSTLRNRSFTVVKRRAHTKVFRFFARHHADRRGTFRYTITGDLGDCFLMRLPRTGSHRATTVSLGCIHVIN